MGHHGPSGAFHRSTAHPKAYPVSSRVQEIRKRTLWLYSAISRTSPTGITFSILAILVMLLCQSRLIESSLHSSCPDQCACSNTTTTSTVLGTWSVMTIDCSNGSLQGFVELLSRNGHSPANSNVTDASGLSGSPGNGSNEGLSNVADNVTGQTNETLPSITEDNFLAQHNLHKMTYSPSVGDQRHDLKIDLSFNNVSSLRALGLHDWKSASAVTELNLSSNRIENLDRSYFQSFTNILVLDLSNNLIGTFKPGVFQNMSSLKYLYLQNNGIAKVVPPSGDSVFVSNNLVHLDLSHNSLLTLPAGVFSHFPMLSTLNLTHNHIAIIDRFAFAGLSQLQSLFLSYNNVSSLDYPVFQNTSLVILWLDSMPRLSHLSHNVFQGLTHLHCLNLSQNPLLTFLHHDILSGLQSLQTLDLSGTSIQKLSSLTFRNNPGLHNIDLSRVPLSCQCANAWLVEHIHKNDSFLHNASSLQCINTKDNQTIPIADAIYPCSNVSVPDIHTKLSVVIGSTLTLQCKQTFSSGDDILTWTTPRGDVYHYHHFHPNASQHLFSPKDVQPHAPFHKNHIWHQSSSYYSELDSHKERILLLSDGSLFIDYILRTDAGTYKCVVRNTHFNDSGSIQIQFSYKISGETKIIACIVGILCAIAFFTLNVIYVVISWLARRLINKRRREHIRQMLENLNSYKSTHITRIYENYTGQLNRVRNRYHVQRDRLHKNYTMQVDRVKRGCSHQVEKVRDNYNNRLTQLREYSSSQIVQIREMATNQIGRIRDYGSLQLDRLRENYKLQHQHMMKLLDTMNLDNCRSIVETECMRTESMMYDLDLLSQEDVRMESPFSMGDADSEYNTAASSPLMSVSSQELINPSSHQTKNDAGDHYELVGEKDQYFNAMEGVAEPEEVLKVTRSENTTGRGSVGHEADRETVDDIEIEMNTVLHLPGNVQLDAQEVWTYGKGDDSTHTLYTRIHSPGNVCEGNAEGQDRSVLEKNGPPNEGAMVKDGDGYKTIGSSLPSIDSAMLQQSEWDVAYVEQEDSPNKVWVGPPPLFHYNSLNDCTTVNLYDSNEEEDEEEDEKTERDTMV